MKILLTGGAGFIGSNLGLRLISEGHEVTVLDNLSPQIHGDNPLLTSPLYNSIVDKVRFIHGTVCDRTVLLECLKGQDAVVHLAAETGTGQSMYEICRYVDVNIGGTALLLELLSEYNHNIKRVVVASSRAIYGEGKYRKNDGTIVYPGARKLEDLSAGKFDLYCPVTGEELELMATDEESKIQPSSIYGITKQNQEQMIMTVCPTLDIEPVALRYQNVYGPGQSLKNPYTGILSIFSTCIMNNNSINIFEDGKESRDFVFIDDVVNATCLSIFKSEAAGQVFGIGSGVPVDVFTVANALAMQYRRDVPIRVTGEFRIGDIRHNYADLTKARTLLGFEPSIGFEEGIHSFSRWVENQDVPQDAYANSLRELAERGLLNSTTSK
jgi:dTDP-L-rhamnose 4-epimerase